MELSKYIQPAVSDMASKLDAEILEAVRRRWGNDWTIEMVVKRCNLIRLHGQSYQTLYADGVPVLEIHDPIFHEPMLEGDRYISRITQNFRHLQASRTVPTENV